MYVIEGWDGVHNIAFFVAPQIMVRHFEIRPTVQKLALIEVSKALRLEMTVKRSKNDRRSSSVYRRRLGWYPLRSIFCGTPNNGMTL